MLASNQSFFLVALLALACAHSQPPALEEPAVMTTPHHLLTILAVADLERSLAFYTEAFGWPLRVDAPVYKELELPDGRGLGLYQREAYAKNTGLLPDVVPAGAITGTEIYLHVGDLEAAVQRLRKLGARELSPPSERPWGDRAAYFADPDGNVLVVAKPLDG